MPDAPLPPGSIIGILGGGQLGRMLALAAARLGMKTHIFCPDPDSPAFDVTPRKTVAAYDDEAALAAFADAVDVVTYEFENVPAATAEFLAARKPLRPGARPLAIAQDRLKEKAFLTICRVPVAPFAAIPDTATLLAELDRDRPPRCAEDHAAGLRRQGPADGPRRGRRQSGIRRARTETAGARGLRRLRKGDLGGRRAWRSTAKSAPLRQQRTSIATTSSRPAPSRPTISSATAEEAYRLAGAIVEALDYVGVLGIEFFVLPGGKLLCNEIAPRVHNSGHWTEAVCVTDQFEQHIRAIAGWPLGDTRRLAPVVMENLIGDEASTLPGALEPGIRPQLYGKAESRPGRKMGHLNRVAPANGQN